MTSPGAGVAPAVETLATPTGDKSADELCAPEGWTKKLVPAKKTPKRKDVVYIAPDGEEIKSKRQLDKYLKAHPGGPVSSDFDWSTGETPRRSARLLKTPTRLSSDSTEAEQPGGKRAKREAGGGKGNDLVMEDKNEDQASEEVEAVNKDVATGESDKAATKVERAEDAHLNGTSHKESEEEKKNDDGNPDEGAERVEKVAVTGAKLADESVELTKDMVIEKEPVEQNAVGESVELDVKKPDKEADVEMKDEEQEIPNAENGSELNNNGEKVEILANGSGVDEKTEQAKGGSKLDEQFGAKKTLEGEVPQSTESLQSAGAVRSAVKAALHLSTVPGTILCRESEQQKVTSFCKQCILQQVSASLYICGCPGTGKSLTVEKIKLQCVEWAEEGGTGAPEIVVLNCTSVSRPDSIYGQVLQLLDVKNAQKYAHASRATSLPEIKKLSIFKATNHDGQRRMLLLILDEIDYLITKDQSVLYDLFQLSTLPNSRCILIGIANAIDLTDRFLPRLHALNCKPDVITFPAYKSDQILLVLKQRLQALPHTVFDAAALELCARKVAAASGDMRQALLVCRLALEAVEAEAEQKLRQEPPDGAVCSASDAGKVQRDQKPSTMPTLCKVKIGDMAKALARTYKSPVVDTIQALPQHQQIVLCVAVRLFRRAKKDSTLGQLNDAYVAFCKNTSMPSLAAVEFSSVCRVLADQALIKLGAAREDRLRRVALQVDENDVIFALQAVRFFRNILV